LPYAPGHISQPAFFFRRSSLRQTGPLREDLVAAWDYELMLRLWRTGPGVLVHDHHQGPLSEFLLFGFIEDAKTLSELRKFRPLHES
jgi:hypothetical protein